MNLAHTMESEGLKTNGVDRLLKAKCNGKHPTLGMCWLPREDIFHFEYEYRANIIIFIIFKSKFSFAQALDIEA